MALKFALSGRKKLRLQFQGKNRPAIVNGNMKFRQRLHLLFVCSRNQWRSPTAEKVYQDDPRVEVRSRGTTKAAVRTITLADIQWADVILVMEPKHQKRLLADFPAATRYKPIRVLDIPDEYQRMDPELVELILEAVEPVIEDLLGGSATL